mmetsp:Transcript_26808/g.43075  ORF Transcript_26808/g.43075 Transcript_26808/m.43075 type:complete len:365 (+) Transcript_26808:192-1286(+)
MSQALADTAVTYSVVLGVSVQVAILTIGCFYNFMDGWTLIVWASDRGYASCVSRLISWGFDVHDFDNGGESAIVKASRNGHADTVRELLKANADPTGGLMPAAGKKGWDALSVASYQGHPLVVRQLLEAGANPNTAANGAEAAIMLASKGGHHELISTLVEHKANPNIRGEMERTPLVVSCIRNQKKCVAQLIDAKADLEIPDKNGLTPLIWASVHGYLPIVKLLVAKGANVETHDKTQRSGLMWAAVQLKWETARYLVKNGATADKTDFEQIRADLRRTWRRSKDYVAMAMMLLQDAPKIYNHEARLSFLLGTHHRVGCDSLIRKLSLGTKERKSEVQNIVSEIFAFLPGGDHERADDEEKGE